MSVSENEVWKEGKPWQEKQQFVHFVILLCLQMLLTPHRSAENVASVRIIFNGGWIRRPEKYRLDVDRQILKTI